MRVMEERFWRVALSLALILREFFTATDAVPEACRRPSAVELMLSPPAICLPSDIPAAGTGFGNVLEGDEITLQRAVSIVHNSREQYIAVLFYSSRCPFSKKCRPNFNNMLALFPNIPHFAFEESVIRPSILSRHGVHGFPTLFLLNSSTRVRYRGPRSINFLTAFYFDVTGIKPTPAALTISDKPISHASSLENFLRQDAYLAFASSFVLLRLLYFLLPKMSYCIKKVRGWPTQFPSSISLCDFSQAFLEQTRRCFSRLNPGKRTNLQEGAMNAKAWVSKSLVSVSVGEPSSARASTLQ